MNEPALPRRSWRDALVACAALRQTDRDQRAPLDRLLAFLSPCRSEGAAEDLADLDGDAWAVLFESIRAARLGPLLHTQLGDTIARRLPSAVRAGLDDAYAHAHREHDRRQRSLAAVLDHFQRGGVRVAILKGPYLAEHVYADPAVRPMVDFDVLVSQRDLRFAERILFDQGYGPSLEWRPSVAWSTSVSDSLPDLWKAGETSVELHWTIVHPRSPFTIDVEQLWRRLLPTQLAGRRAWVPDLEDQLLHLCIHAAYQHGFERPLLCYYEIALLAEQSRHRLDWNRLIERAHSWRAARIVFVALQASLALFNVPAPNHLRSALSDRAVDWLVAQVVADHTVRRASVGSSEWLVTRSVLDAWLRAVVGQWPPADW